MKRWTFLWILFGFASLSFFWLTENSQSLRGLWKIHIIETLDPSSGKWKEHGWMKGGQAYLHYDGQQHMSVHFTPNGYDSLQVPDEVDSLQMEELKVLASDYWYIAKYEVDHNNQIVKHHRIIHSDPGEWGREVLRKFEFKEDTLILSPIEFNLRLKWIRQ